MQGKKESSTELSVMVLDDDPDIRQVIVMALEDSLGFKVVELDSNDRVEDAEIKSIIESGKVDVVFCDGKTSGRQKLSGPEVVCIVRKLNPSTRVFVCTGMPTVDFLSQCRQAGADAFICKPFRIKELEEALSAESFYTNFQPPTQRSIGVLPVTVTEIISPVFQIDPATVSSFF